MSKKCDNTSVGILVWRDGRLLLIEQRKFPFGFAAPAGHVDGHGSYEDAACAELSEEVGLTATNLRLVYEGRKDNPCRREGGDWHHWKIYEADTEDEAKCSLDETKQAGWHSSEEIRKLSERTQAYLREEVSREEWEKAPGLEPVLAEFLRELKIVELT